MAPSRGTHHTTPATPSSHSVASSSHDTNHDHKAINQQSSTALASARRNLSYLINPSAAGTTAPTRLRTRALLRTLRYFTQFIFWRVVRYAKYAAVAAIAAAIGATAFGSVVTGVAWIAAPPTIATSVFASVIWGVGKMLAKRAHKRWEKTGGDAGVVVREEVEDGRGTVRSEGSYGLDVGPGVVPW